MKRLALALSLLAGCHDGDPCSGHDGTCVGLTVRGNGVSALDQLRFSVKVAGNLLTASSPPLPGRPVALPALTALYFTLSGAAQIDVEGDLNGAAIAAGATAITLVPGAHTQATVTLDALGGSDGAIADFSHPSDLSSTDLAVADLAVASDDLAVADLAAARDLTGADLKINACPAGTTFCDDFEGEDNSFARWNGSTGSAMATFALDNTQPFLHGSQSFEVSSTGGSFSLHKVISSPVGSMAVRFYFYAAGTAGAGATYLYLTQTSDSVALSASAGNAWAVTTGVFASTGGTVATDAWRCIELDFDLIMATYSLYDTSASAPNNSAPPVLTGTFTSSTFSALNLGVYSPPTSGGADVWFDDLAVGFGHIGCE